VARSPSLDDAVVKVYRYGQDEKVFAGLVASGTTLFVGFTEEPLRHLARLRAQLSGVTLRAFLAEYSLGHLARVAQHISQELPHLREEGLGVVTVGVDERKNRVRIGLAEWQPYWVEVLCNRYGRGVLAFHTSGRVVAALRSAPPDPTGTSKSSDWGAERKLLACPKAGSGAATTVKL